MNINYFEDIEDPKVESSYTKTIVKTQIEYDKNNNITENSRESIVKKNCSELGIIHNECKNGKMSNNQVDTIFQTLVEDILKDENYHGENTVIETENVIFQLSTLEDQKNSNSPNISSIDLNECENILRKKCNLSDDESLIVIKTDIKSPDLSSTYVQYEVYNPHNLEPLSLEDCKGIKIVVNVPVNLDDKILSYDDSVSESGYNIYDSEDDFYNDICSTYTSQNGTDMTLEDRKKEIYSTTESLTICQDGCKTESYNRTTKKAKCNCDVQTSSTQTNITKINFSKDALLSSFIGTIKNSNFLVLKCYKLALSIKNVFKNIGRIIMTIFYLLFIISLLIYIIKDKMQIRNFINNILRQKENNILKEKEDKNNIYSKDKSKKSKKIINNKMAKRIKLKKNEIIKIKKII
jgi:hypothetical protein